MTQPVKQITLGNTKLLSIWGKIKIEEIKNSSLPVSITQEYLKNNRFGSPVTANDCWADLCDDLLDNIDTNRLWVNTTDLVDYFEKITRDNGQWIAGQAVDLGCAVLKYENELNISKNGGHIKNIHNTGGMHWVWAEAEVTLLEAELKRMKIIANEEAQKSTYEVVITETLSRVIEVKAIDIEDAISKVSEQYYDGKIILESDDFCEVNFDRID